MFICLEWCVRVDVPKHDSMDLLLDDRCSRTLDEHTAIVVGPNRSRNESDHNLGSDCSSLSLSLTGTGGQR